MNKENNFIKFRIIIGAVLCTVIFILGYTICFGYESGTIKPYSEERTITSGDASAFEIKTEAFADSVIIPVNAENADTKNKIDINTADISELTTLYGIGKTKARAIVIMRYEIGGFLYVEDLMNVSGIGEKTFEKIKDNIYVSEIDENVRKEISSYAGFV